MKGISSFGEGFGEGLGILIVNTPQNIWEVSVAKEKESGERQEEQSFEVAFQRIEGILEKMNSSQTPLDESLKLFEEANGLINLCSKRLKEAEKRVETLIKNRNGELETGPDGQPKVEVFSE